jgi:peptidoglycan/LPS O-acetylase OafA/YrhL
MEGANDQVGEAPHRRLAYLPGLDGVRAFAVVAVMMYHGGLLVTTGGFMGVDTFFVLSGFLITSLLVCERDRDGRISLRRFWSRRFRRLLPAAWLTLALIVVVMLFTGTGLQNKTARWDIIASLAQVANWRFLFSGSSYAALFRTPSPVLHFWSLSLEEQFYLVFPAATVLLVGLRRGRKLVLPVVIAAGMIASWAAPILFHLGHDRTYYGTDTRAGELLVGALLALLIANPDVRATLTHSWLWRTTAAAVGSGALVVMVVLWFTVQETSSFVTNGGLALHGLIAVTVIVAAILPTGPVRWLCSLAPLRWLGRISYGVYLVHWPLLVFLTEQRTHLGHLPRFLLVIALSLLLAQLSATYVERPIRDGRPIWGGLRIRPARIAPVAVVLVVVGCLALPTASASTQFDADTAAAQLHALQSKNRAGTTASTTTPKANAVAPAPNWDIFGDSVALSLALVFGDWEKQTASMHGIGGDAQVGCGIVRGGYRKFTGIQAIRPECDAWPVTWPEEIKRTNPQIAVVTSCQWETVDRKLAGDSAWRSLGDPVYDARVKADLLQATDVLSSQGALVIWLSCSQFGDADDAQDNPDILRSHQPARVDRLNAIIRDVVASRPDTARLVDLGAWMAPHVQDTSIRSDGEHYDLTPQDDVVRAFLGPAILSTWRDWWKSHH